jgi:hypothetical protein
MPAFSLFFSVDIPGKSVYNETKEKERMVSPWQDVTTTKIPTGAESGAV